MSNTENDTRLLMKCIKVNYNGVEVSGEEAFRKLVIDADLLGKAYTIDWSRGCEINTY